MRFEERIGLGPFLEAYPGMRVQPSSSKILRLKGDFEFKANHEGGPTIEDSYRLRIDIPGCFPKQLPKVEELDERIPRHIDHHMYSEGVLCLGSPLRLHMIARKTPSLTSFARQAIVPYLYATSYREQTDDDSYPFGELAHGRTGLLTDYAQLLGLSTPEQAAEALELLGTKRRLANKRPCPCGCGQRLGVCRFNETIRHLRSQLGRPLFRRLHRQVQEQPSHPQS